VDVAAVEDAIAEFARRHRVDFEATARRQSQWLEFGALVVVSQHYQRKGFAVRPMNLIAGRFKVKLSSRGRPRNFSWFEVSTPTGRFEMHSNLAVQGAYDDGGVFVVDVGVVRAGAVSERPGGALSCDHRDLVTFAEVKALTVYPMLLAQFVGIVHELLPRCLPPVSRRPHGFHRQGHFDPALLSLGHFSGTSRLVADGFQARKYRLQVVPALDVKLAVLRGDPTAPSPLAP
jgi:hypothetical protein